MESSVPRFYAEQGTCYHGDSVVTMKEKPAMSREVKHVVLAQFKDGTSQETIDALVTEYVALPKLIPEMKHFEWGTDCNIEGASKGFTHCFITTFDSIEGRDIYVPHPAHQAYAKKLIANLANVLVVDFQPH